MSLIRSKIGEKVNGIVCLYKPLDISILTFRSSFQSKLCDVLNSEGQPQVMDEDTYIDFHGSDTHCINIKPNYENHLLVKGPRFNWENVKVVISTLGRRISGVCGINGSIPRLLGYHNRNHPMVFHVSGKLGEATVNFYKDDKIIKKANYSRVKKATINDVVSFMESAYQRDAYKNLGIDLRSQAAYELAISGEIKPKNPDVPFLYSIKCIEFNPPEFTLEITSLGVTEFYLMKLIHDLGLKLRVFAHCTGIRCIRNGQFTVKHSLVKGEWTLENISNNIMLCKKLLQQDELFKNKNKESLSKSTM